MGRRGNQTFAKNQKAQKRVARANAKRTQQQERRDEKAARAAAGEPASGPPIDWSAAGVPRDEALEETTDGEAPSIAPAEDETA
jgi:hypothetical protein